MAEISNTFKIINALELVEVSYYGDTSGTTIVTDSRPDPPTVFSNPQKYDDAIPYNLGDFVVYEVSSVYNLYVNTSETGSTNQPPTNTTYWDEVQPNYYNAYFDNSPSSNVKYQGDFTVGVNVGFMLDVSAALNAYNESFPTKFDGMAFENITFDYLYYDQFDYTTKLLNSEFIDDISNWTDESVGTSSISYSSGKLLINSPDSSNYGVASQTVVGTSGALRMLEITSAAYGANDGDLTVEVNGNTFLRQVLGLSTVNRIFFISDGSDKITLKVLTPGASTQNAMCDSIYLYDIEEQNGEILNPHFYGGIEGWSDTSIGSDASAWDYSYDKLKLATTDEENKAIVENALTLTAGETYHVVAKNNSNSTGDLKILALGPDIIVNGDFATDTIWGKLDGWSIGGGVASCDGTQTSNSYLFQTVSGVLIGDTIFQKIDVLNYSVGTVKSVVNAGQLGEDRTANGTYFDLLTYTGTTQNFIFADSSFVGDIDNVSAKKVLGSMTIAAGDISSFTFTATADTTIVLYCDDDASNSLVDFCMCFNDDEYLNGKNRYAITDLTEVDEPYLNLHMITPGGDVKLGELVLGEVHEIGETQSGVSYRNEVYATDDGEGNITSQGVVRRIKYPIFIENINTDTILQLLEKLEGKPIYCIGDTDLERTYIYGYHVNSDISENDTIHSEMDLEIRELI